MSSNFIAVSAPGKVILHGEHAVVYGKSAIASSVNLRSYLKLVSTGNGMVHISLPAINIDLSWNTDEIIALTNGCEVNIQQPDRPSEEVIQKIHKFVNLHQDPSAQINLAVVAFLYLYSSICQQRRTEPSCDIKLVSELPVGAGLGSSASFSVCLSTALLLYQKYITAPVDGRWNPDDLDLINKWAFQGERIIHGNPSGIDNSVATFGGAIKFQGGQITKLDSMPSLKILLTSTHVPRSTKQLVSGVKHRLDKYPDIINPVMDSIEAVTEKCQQIYRDMSNTSIEHGDHYTVLEDLIDINQHLLQVLGVSHVTLDKICHVTSKYRLHSKLTGAGGGGCAVTLLAPGIDTNIIENIKRDLEPDGFKCWQTEIGGVGVTPHNELPDCLL